jgi:hypothetical protein
MLEKPHKRLKVVEDLTRRWCISLPREKEELLSLK